MVLCSFFIHGRIASCLPVSVQKTRQASHPRSVPARTCRSRCGIFSRDTPPAPCEVWLVAVTLRALSWSLAGACRTCGWSTAHPSSGYMLHCCVCTHVKSTESWELDRSNSCELLVLRMLTFFSRASGWLDLICTLPGIPVNHISIWVAR